MLQTIIQRDVVAHYQLLSSHRSNVIVEDSEARTSPSLPSPPDVTF